LAEEVAPADVSIDLEELRDNQEPDFPVVELGRLDEMINRPRWVVPVLPKGELEVLLDTAIKLCKEGMSTHSHNWLDSMIRVFVF
jgi:ubiquitin carboxyl-terminal hydrolase 9/24